MSKITTKSIKERIDSWLNTSDVELKLRDFFVTEATPDNEVIWLNYDFRFPLYVSKEEFRTRVFERFINCDSWTRVCHTVLDYSQIVNDLKMFSQATQDDRDKFFHGDIKDDTRQISKKCVKRTFIPAKPLDDYFRLEVVTNETDTEVIAWWIEND